MIKTSSYKNYDNIKNSISISFDRGEDAKYQGECYPTLAPKKEFWRIWKDNIGKVPELENNYFYIREYYKQVLSNLDIEKVYRELKDKTLLCYEDSEYFCHRHIVAAWFELVLGVETLEIVLKGNKLDFPKTPKYIKEYLEQVMKENLNMRGFNSLRALYLFEEGEKLEEKARKTTNLDKRYCYMTLACFYRCDADEEEEKYKKNGKAKIKKI